jgi:hypothetical protein
VRAYHCDDYYCCHNATIMQQGVASPPRPGQHLLTFPVACCSVLTGNLLDSDMRECLHMLQPSLLSSPERFALGGGRSGSFLFYQ